MSATMYMYTNNGINGGPTARNPGEIKGKGDKDIHKVTVSQETRTPRHGTLRALCPAGRNSPSSAISVVGSQGLQASCSPIVVDSAADAAKDSGTEGSPVSLETGGT